MFFVRLLTALGISDTYSKTIPTVEEGRDEKYEQQPIDCENQPIYGPQAP
jgi:hypothetical protein